MKKKCKEHIWKKTTFKPYDGWSGYHYYKCQKCGQKKKEWVVIFP